MGDDVRDFRYSPVDFAARKPGRSALPDSVDRPVGKVIAIAWAMQALGAQASVDF